MTFERIAAKRPDGLFVWLDIEDDAAICGDIDVENFPTLAIYRGATLLHYGISLPQEGAVAPLLDEMAGRRDVLREAPEPVLALPNPLRLKPTLTPPPPPPATPISISSPPP